MARAGRSERSLAGYPGARRAGCFRHQGGQAPTSDRPVSGCSSSGSQGPRSRRRLPRRAGSCPRLVPCGPRVSARQFYRRYPRSRRVAAHEPDRLWPQPSVPFPALDSRIHRWRPTPSLEHRNRPRPLPRPPGQAWGTAEASGTRTRPSRRRRSRPSSRQGRSTSAWRKASCGALRVSAPRPTPRPTRLRPRRAPRRASRP